MVKHRHGHLVFHHRHDPMHIAQVAPAGVEKQVALMNAPAADEDGCGQRYETEPDMLGMRHQRRPLAKVFAVGIGDDGTRQRDFNFGMRSIM
jgi:hypothetical protein